eukprot:gene56638-77614_t
MSLQVTGLALAMASRHGLSIRTGDHVTVARQGLGDGRMKMKTLAALTMCAAALTSCYSSGPRPLPVVEQRPSVDGEWADPNGIVSTFQAGTFMTRTTDTNQILASGSYMMVSDRLVEINLTSLVRNTQQKVNCALVTPSQLNCTSDSGAQFSLARRA